MPIRWSDRRLCLTDNTPTTRFDRHYIYHPAWAARVLAQLRPAVHIDVSSKLYFSAIVSAFLPIKFLDYRPARLSLSGLECGQGDLLSLPFADASVASLSCMHTVEHIGLGRYGDRLDPDGDIKSIAELKRVLAPAGSLLFVVPIGEPRIQFNAHRIYAYHQIRAYFNDLELKEFALVPDKEDQGGLIIDAPESMADSQTYGCGCFWFQKPQ
ncbi:MAG TPA: DUF268 domain-containing protein [Pirellulales bacterium]|nr:DUF268 domain-containing protein [Pirellulales bacterium]